MGSNRRGYNGVWFIFCISTLVCAGRSLDAPGPSLPIGGLLHRRRIFASRWARTAEGTTAFGSSFVFQLSCAQAGVWMHPVHPYLSGVFSIAGEYSPLDGLEPQRVQRRLVHLLYFNSRVRRPEFGCTRSILTYRGSSPSPENIRL